MALHDFSYNVTFAQSDYEDSAPSVAKKRQRARANDASQALPFG
jgi:hypothetical protein